MKTDFNICVQYVIVVLCRLIHNVTQGLPKEYGYRQRQRKHFESGGALAKRSTCVYDQDQAILCRSRAVRTKIFKKWGVYNVGNDLYRVFTTAEWALSFQQKRAFIQEIFFSFLVNLNEAL